MADHVGQVLGNYRLMQLLGRGGFAEVYLGEHLHLKTQAAIKLLNSNLTPADVEIFIKEAQTIAVLHHPHIVHILDFGFDAGTPFLVMQYAAQGTLRDRHPRGSVLPLSTILSYVKPIATALDYAHQARVIHRDIKPENMLNGGNKTVLLSDFGIATTAHSTATMHTIESIGTPHYMAPEQFRGRPCPASDQYALAIVVYEWLCGQRPFTGNSFFTLGMHHQSAPVPSLRKQNNAISLPVEQVIFQALAKDPKRRFTGVEAFVLALEQASLAPQRNTLQTHARNNYPHPRTQLHVNPVPQQRFYRAPVMLNGSQQIQVQTEPRCPFCSNPMSDDSVFCGICGSLLKYPTRSRA
jgi:serine/threonine protein kinase